MARIAIIDDHALLSEVLRRSLAGNGHDANVLTIDDTLLDQVRELAPELTLLDLELGPDVAPGQELITALRPLSLHVVVVSGVTDELVLAQCLEAGAAGIVSKAAPFDDLVASITACLDGQQIDPPAGERQRLLRELAEHRRSTADSTRPFDALSAREAEVLHMLRIGLSATEMSEQSFVAVSTVRSQIKAILRKLNVSSQLQAVALANAAGWQAPEPIATTQDGAALDRSTRG